MNAAKWQAQWIWAAGTAEDNNVYAEARTTFEAEEPAGRAVLRISANQSYKLFLNGEEVGRGPAPADLAWMSYDTYEVAERLRAGTNVLAVVAHNFGREDIVTHQLQGPGGLICQLDLYAEAGGAGGEPLRTIASGPDWKCRRSPRWKPNVSRLHRWGGYREIVDAAREDGWEEAGYDDSAWPSAVAVAAAEDAGSPWPRLLPREIPFLRQTAVKPAAVVAAESYLGAVSSPEAMLSGDRPGEAELALTLDASVPGSIPQVVYDFGAERVGYPELEVFAEEGGVLQLFYGESLELSLMDTYLLRKGFNRLSPFGRRAFRFLKVAAMATPAPIAVRSLSVRSVHYPYAGDGTFRCSDEKLTRIWETGRYTTIVNSQNHFEDCPYREAALWVADSVVMAKVVYQTFGDPALVRKSLLQAARIQNEDGSIPGTGPQRNPFLLPDFCAHWLFGVWEYYAYSGDLAFLEEIWPYAVRVAEWFENQEDDAGLFARADREGWWCFIDWSDDIERKDRVAAISCFYYKFLTTAARIAETLREPERAADLRGKASKLRHSVRSLLRVPGTVVYADCLTASGLSASVTAQTNFAAAWSGIMDDAEVAAFVREGYLSGKLPPIRGAFFYHIVLETLFRHGWAGEAVKLIRDYWGAMLDRGATTWWETFDPSLPFPTTPSPYLGHTPTYLEDEIPVSLSHGWGASPTCLLTREVLGVNVSDAGIGDVSLQPSAVPGVEWAEGTVPTKLGDIRAEWRREKDGTAHFTAELPDGLSWTAPGLEGVTISEAAGLLRITGIVPARAREHAV
ncbi:alpha-L-rhamnosidase N-terminal domain-containing protein [Cohnella zeiphila]|uniref:Alpha-L-rhamnosidase N-terminal domain-containing protein n=1 Tax=Cohnella zeiphila TaxID=2761120 RepID=A0A7X0VVS3_9BACL|nr:alpha-L-rhamnosidase N-terminal domain-containing protein [Cohnella zeiphila]MBB6731677.1 alpha-L-rhamnosidase N-terminal domain-containing protein [Cohnella zeiphila]